jgi:hypothetical protein
MRKPINREDHHREEKGNPNIQHSHTLGNEAVFWASAATIGNTDDIKNVNAVAIARDRPQAGIGLGLAL